MIALGSDHGGYGLKQEVKAYLEGKGIPYKDYGCLDESPCDYPVYAKAVAKAIVDGECDKGILICGTGIGISIAANKVFVRQFVMIHLAHRQRENIMTPIFLLWGHEWLDRVLH